MQPKFQEYKFEHPFESQQKEIFKRLYDFQEMLSDEQDIGLQAVGYPLFNLLEAEWTSPHIIFSGEIKNEPVQLIQHISLVNFMLSPVAKQLAKARRLGFGD